MSPDGAVVVGIVVVLVIALLVGVRVWRRDPLLRRVRFGVFLERERFEEDELERGFDRDENY